MNVIKVNNLICNKQLGWGRSRKAGGGMKHTCMLPQVACVDAATCATLSLFVTYHTRSPGIRQMMLTGGGVLQTSSASSRYLRQNYISLTKVPLFSVKIKTLVCYSIIIFNKSETIAVTRWKSMIKWYLIAMPDYLRVLFFLHRRKKF